MAIITIACGLFVVIFYAATFTVADTAAIVQVVATPREPVFPECDLHKLSRLSGKRIPAI